MRKYGRSLVMFFLLGILSKVLVAQPVQVTGKNIQIEFNKVLHSRIVAIFNGRGIPLGDYSPSESVMVAGHPVTEFTLAGQSQAAFQDGIGAGHRWTLTGRAAALEKRVVISLYADFPQMAFFQVYYTNKGTLPLTVEGWSNQSYRLPAQEGTAEPAFWSYQSGSYESRPDWVLPLKSGFSQENYLGMNGDDYGGGTPVIDVWRRDVGIGVGHVERVPKLVSLPVTSPQGNLAAMAVKFKQTQTLPPGETLETLQTFVCVHQGDYFQTLKEYRRFMIRKGVHFNPAPDDAFAPIWCAWGYERGFTPAQIYNALPVVKKLGFGWVTVDDGWQTAEGDWYLLPGKFPGGDRDLRAMTDRIHAEGFKAQLWWDPLAVKPQAERYTQHPEQLLLNRDGSKQKISYWDAFYLCPADPAVLEYHRQMVIKIMRDWGFDGLKLDGQFMNGAPPCYNPAHKHPYPEVAVEAMPAFFKMIYDTARSIKPNALVEFCPCGTGYNFFTLPYMNMSVGSDPTSSWQVRLKGKTLKALAGDESAYFGDHVELSDGGVDFASSVGIGAVVGTNFTWPVGSFQKATLDLTAERERLWAKWLKIYHEKMLPRGEYLGTLYDLGFDKPEAHAIRKGKRLYYAFYAPEWKGQIQLRGLAAKRYQITDYEDQHGLGTVTGPTALLTVEFRNHLLLEASPE